MCLAIDRSLLVRKPVWDSNCSGGMYIEGNRGLVIRLNEYKYLNLFIRLSFALHPHNMFIR